MHRRLLSAVTASLCFSLAGLALGFAVADLASASVHAWMREWEERGYVSDQNVWERSYSRLRMARRLNPLNAAYSADLGRLMEWQSWRQLSDSAERLKHRAHAGEFYEETIGKRPTWGFVWAHYAENQLLSGNRGSKFVEALEKAILLAPWEPGVQRKVAWMGMATWGELPIPTRGMVEDSIRRTLTLEFDLEELVRLAVQYDWLDRLRPMMRTGRQTAAVSRVLEQLRKR